MQCYRLDGYTLPGDCTGVEREGRGIAAAADLRLAVVDVFLKHKVVVDVGKCPQG